MAFEIEKGVLKKYTEEDGVTEVTIPDGVTSIEYRAFAFCRNLTSITIPESVKSIGENAFENCTNLTSVTIHGNVKIINRWTFSGCTSLTNITLPDSVKTIKKWAFENCRSLTDITIPDNVTNIGYGAFYGCTSLKSITLPDSYMYIYKSAFYGGTKIIIREENLSFTLKGEWKIKKPELTLDKFLTADINSRQQYFSDLPDYYRIPIAISVVSAYPQETYYLDYLKNNTEDIVRCLTDTEDIDLLYKFLDFGFVTENNIDSLISYAVSHTQNGGSSEPQLILSKYKSDNFSPKNADTFDKFIL